MKRLYPLFLFMLVATAFTNSDNPLLNYPKNYFRAPVSHTMLLSGTFGELRPNHFHAGIDVKPSTPGKTGQSLYAVADGHVERIKVSSVGYGNTLYISHPNGYTSVYAHLGRFSKKLREYIKQKQYEKKSFEIEVYPNPQEFTFKKGEVIGTLGLSGRSFGAHLHFEIRDTKTEKPINPLLFGFKVKDNIAPKLHELKVYSLNDKHETLDSKIIKFKKTKYGYRLSDTLYVGAWRCGLALKAYDHMNGVGNWNGVYSMEMFVDDSLAFDFKMETFSFDETRYINAHMDFRDRLLKKAYFNRCFRLPGNNLSIYNKKLNDGIITLSKYKAQKVEFIVKDVAGNKSNLKFYIKRKDVPEPKPFVHNYLLPYAEESYISLKDAYFHFPKNSFYENLYLNLNIGEEKSADVYSKVFQLGDYTVPVHTYFDVALQPVGLPEELRDRAFVAYCEGDKVYTVGGKWEGDLLKAQTRVLGNYCIMVDQTPPKITPVSFRADMRGRSKMSWKVKDNIKTTKPLTDFKSYKLEIDGEWVLLKFDQKNNLMYHIFDDTIKPGKHELKLSVEDQAGNVGEYVRSFTR